MVSYENTITFIFFIPALLCVLIGLFSMLTCGCCCFCNNEQESPPPIRRRRRQARRRDHYIRMSDCESTNVTPRGPASWRCRGIGHTEPENIYMYRDRRLCANFDTVVGPAPPSYTVTMQHHCNYSWNQPATAVARGSGANTVRMVESNHSHVHNVSLIRVMSGAEDSEETRLDELEEEEEEEGMEEEEEKEEEGEGQGRDGSSSPPPPYDKRETTNQKDSH